MELLTTELYNTLSNVGNTFFMYLDDDVNTSETLIVFEVNETGSHSSFSGYDHGNDVSLTVKIHNQDTLELFKIANQIKGLLLNQDFKHVRDIQYKSSVPIFQDIDLGTWQYTLLFDLYADSTVQTITNLFLNLSFPLGAATIQEITITEQEKGSYHTEQLTNIATVIYSVNGVVTSLPFSLIAGDLLGIEVLIIDTLETAKITMEGEA